MAGFADLNLPQGLDKKSLQSLVEAAAHLGYSVVALNHVIDFKEKKQEIIKPVSPSELFPSLPIVQGTSKKIKVLTRLTLVVSDPSHCNLLIACTTLDVDLVCINVTEKLPFYFRRPPVNMAIDRGIYFELLYTPAIKDSTMRRYTISNAISLMQICKGKNIVISSAAERPLELRGPYDVANLYPFPKSKAAVSRVQMHFYYSLHPRSTYLACPWKEKSMLCVMRNMWEAVWPGRILCATFSSLLK
ncbi:ribonuclease P protein subunit p30 isoform X3 [Poecile atricapillus]|uniref:ribonuclease P protein subunit p30 isoform X3 n=1 Tax=Poecile atricapillus TaxID=48891 RepID=UPI00273A17C1|nr:ribonuclease P protein subunit p30 isoform X3 [Poecile atricapillus]